MRLCLTPTRGPRIHGERSNNGAVGNGGLDNSGAKNREKGERNNQRGVAGDKKLKPCRGLVNSARHDYHKRVRTRRPTKIRGQPPRMTRREARESALLRECKATTGGENERLRQHRIGDFR